VFIQREKLTLDTQVIITIPCTLTMNVQKIDFFHLLEAQLKEHLLVDKIVSSSTSNISNQYYSQALMAQRLQRAQLEVELYKLAISKDGLNLLDGMYKSIINSIII
jgi:predicted nucleotidyltransferase